MRPGRVYHGAVLPDSSGYDNPLAIWFTYVSPSPSSPETVGLAEQGVEEERNITLRPVVAGHLGHIIPDGPRPQNRDT